MTWAELRDLVVALPEDSATKAAAAGDEDGRRWSQDTYLDAATVNLLQLIATTLWKAHLKGDPPEMTAIEPPKLAADEQRQALEEAKNARNRAVLDSLAPGRTPASEETQGDLAQWMAKIRDLETARQQ
ncbi:hypothetical protein [Streptomyces sp. NPDC008150]|uniref:hypothetical protein n=1 Tax=Streptomyces sp. NPDC008150 TaxID=3364816 RepID=UPI0036EE79D0